MRSWHRECWWVVDFRDIDRQGGGRSQRVCISSRWTIVLNRDANQNWSLSPIILVGSRCVPKFIANRIQLKISTLCSIDKHCTHQAEVLNRLVGRTLDVITPDRGAGEDNCGVFNHGGCVVDGSGRVVDWTYIDHYRRRQIALHPPVVCVVDERVGAEIIGFWGVGEAAIGIKLQQSMLRRSLWLNT